MSKAEKENRIHSFALEFLERQQIVPNLFADQIIIGYKEGYQQAEKDLELTWEDMRELYVIFTEVDAEIELCKADNITAETIGYYEEVLKRFKDYKERREK
jgi:hypothetical protein